MLNKEEKVDRGLYEKLKNSPNLVAQYPLTEDKLKEILKILFKDYKNPTEGMSIKDAEEFNKLMKKN